MSFNSLKDTIALLFISIVVLVGDVFCVLYSINLIREGSQIISEYILTILGLLFFFFLTFVVGRGWKTKLH